MNIEIILTHKEKEELFNPKRETKGSKWLKEFILSTNESVIEIIIDDKL